MAAAQKSSPSRASIRSARDMLACHDVAARDVLHHEGVLGSLQRHWMRTGNVGDDHFTCR
eukprot:m.240990 g.240990  ORF g.240990 m.240990 type:complete len:60 (+) comp17131_c4_seq13:2468-2647(+)